MVSATLRRAGRRFFARYGAAAVALTMACGGAPDTAGGSAADAPADTTLEGLLAAQVRARYTARDLVVSGAWTWPGAGGATWVLLDVQSGIDGIVQGRADLWRVRDSTIEPVGQSDVLVAAAELGAFAFEDLTGDGLPDFLGYVADSAGTRYPVFIVGARGAMADELVAAAPGWRFAAEGDSLPTAVPGPSGAICYLMLWAEAPTPDGGAEGWRFLRLALGGTLEAPRPAPPACGAP